MTGKSENTRTYTAEELRTMTERGEDQTDHSMSHEEAIRRRRADPEAPQPYPGWERTIMPGLPFGKEHLSLRVDRDVLEWFRSFGKGYQTRINSVLRAYYEAHRSGSLDRQSIAESQEKVATGKEARSGKLQGVARHVVSGRFVAAKSGKKTSMTPGKPKSKKRLVD